MSLTIHFHKKEKQYETPDPNQNTRDSLINGCVGGVEELTLDIVVVVVVVGKDEERGWDVSAGLRPRVETVIQGCDWLRYLLNASRSPRVLLIFRISLNYICETSFYV
ncbi:uncharacterized protein H6S33_002214 [Morchella sextelata]|uniref:uncharacterized protein n=1 Tax=Morchella sextelata TaxID=1174677 RepID=UPI001D049B8F|nr:uncharacterized protein H6S33_002214 [Morchella sextelata]KAH0608162.1 hypothetical protein H6S33_002214 [Morchella sextelata]